MTEECHIVKRSIVHIGKFGKPQKWGIVSTTLPSRLPQLSVIVSPGSVEMPRFPISEIVCCQPYTNNQSSKQRDDHDASIGDPHHNTDQQYPAGPLDREQAKGQQQTVKRDVGHKE